MPVEDSRFDLAGDSQHLGLDQDDKSSSFNICAVRDCSMTGP